MDSASEVERDRNKRNSAEAAETPYHGVIAVEQKGMRGQQCEQPADQCPGGQPP